jgi:hypothetical protein
LAKKQYTFDSKGDIIFVKSVKVEALSNEIHFELKPNLKKPVSSVRGSYNF